MNLIRIEGPEIASDDGVQMNEALCNKIRIGRTVVAGVGRSATEGIDSSDVMLLRIVGPTILGEVEYDRKAVVQLYCLNVT